MLIINILSFGAMFQLHTKCYKKGMKKGAHHAVHGTSATLFV